MAYKYTEEEVWDAIHTLSDMRAGFNCFDENDVQKYEACSMGIVALRMLVNTDKSCNFRRKISLMTI